MVPGGSTGYPNLYDPSSNMTLRHSHSLRCWPRPQADILPLTVTGAMGIYTDPCCSRAIDPDMVPSSSSDPNDIMATGGSAGHSARCSSSTTLRA